MKKYIVNHKFHMSITLGIVFLAFLLLCFYAYFPTYSEYVSSNAWNGEEVALSFNGGNGTEENPYQIKTGAELALFKQLLEGEEKEKYLDQYYILMDNIDMGGHDWTPIGNTSDAFCGNFNGNSYTIVNLNFVHDAKDTGMSEYAFFRNVNQATISNLNLAQLTVTLEDVAMTTVVGGLASTIEASTLENISIYNSVLDTSNLNKNEKNITGGLLGQDLGENQIKNIFIDTTVQSKEKFQSGGIGGTLNASSTFEHVIVQSNIENSLSEQKEWYGEQIGQIDSAPFYMFQIIDGTVEIEPKISLEELLTKLNQNIAPTYEWYFDENKLKVRNLISQQAEVIEEELIDENVIAPIVDEETGYLPRAYQEHVSGVVGNTIYINNLTMDQNDYMGQNYITSTNGTLPTLDNKNLYHTNNLVKAQVTYSSSVDINGSVLHSYLSLTEQQNTLVYYDYYPVNTNNTTSTADDYILIELIDNPFTDIPAGYAFNNWITEQSDIEIIYSTTYYTRYAKVPVTYINGVPNVVVLDLVMSYTEATVSKMSDYRSWAGVFSNFLDAGMQKIEAVKVIIEPYDMTGYFLRKTASFGSSYSGYNSQGNPVNTSCWTWGGCTYYERIENQNYVEGTEYYQLQGRNMTLVDNNTLPIIKTEIENTKFIGMNMDGFFRTTTVARNNSIAGYYGENGQTLSGNCTTNGGCTVYEMIQDREIFDKAKTYYYLVTRDTNIAVIDTSITGGWGNNLTKPLTVTSVYDKNDYRSTAYIDISDSDIICYGDTRIENVQIYTRTSFSNSDPSYENNGWWSSSKSSFYGNYHNNKIGRGIIQSGNYVNFDTIIGGSNNSSTGTGSSSNVTKYRLIVESGKVNTIGLVNATSGPTVYVEMQGVYGNDYDRITNNNNNLVVYYCASGSWGGNLYASSTSAKAIDFTVKSGTFGSGKYDYSSGIYVGGRSGGIHYAIRQVKYEGGYTYNLIGGPLSASNRTTTNDIIMNVVGGEIDLITGGAGRSATYGNRIIAITGGKINYSVFAGSNGYEGSSSDGTVNGTGYIYVGGNAVIGDESLVQNGTQLFTVEAGSVFGIGNGRSGYPSIGSNDNSNIIIDGDATILGSVYGGGNYGATGVSSTSNTSYTNIIIHGGTIKNSVYGGGNQNGSGNETKTSTIQIRMDGGTVLKSIYGGSNITGTVYGTTNVTIENGTVKENVYGGGKGVETYIASNVTVTAGNQTVGPNITGSIYGGSAYGTVNATTKTTTVQNATTNVTVNNGIIANSVFGGGQGTGTEIPYVGGNIIVHIYGGNIGNVFGGNDQAGSPNGTVNVYLHGGTVGNAYGGGNKSSVTEPYIYLQGGTVTNLFGGSNESGNVTTTHVHIESGIVDFAFGGNNIGGTNTTSNVVVNGGIINSALYGGGNKVKTGTAHVLMTQSTTNMIPTVFGGGKAADVETTTIEVKDASIDKLFGGSNESGTVTTSNITVTGGTIRSIYGGNNAGGTTANSNIHVTGGSVTKAIYGGGEKANTTTSIVVLESTGNTVPYVFGGGNAASVNTSSLTIKGTSIENLFGGSNESGEVTTSTIQIENGTISNVYGGGNKAAHGTATIRLQNGTVGKIYGGGNEASVKENTMVEILGGTIDSIYGGGNFGTVEKNTTVSLHKGTISGSVYAGGNGASAVVKGNTTLNVEGDPIIGSPDSKAPSSGCLFGGGNAAPTGVEELNQSIATVNITGGTIYGNVYGGANTSVVYGKTYLNIGKETVSNTSMAIGNVNIRGTIFGGGEANASGDENYDYSFISVTDGITVVINGAGHTAFDLSGSIFGSGNASSTTGKSTIEISNYGTRENYKNNISIQRTNQLVISNSAIELSGATDRTNEYSDVLFTLSLIDELYLENNSTLYLQTGTNLLKKFSSTLEENGTRSYEQVTIHGETGEVTQNVDNRIYMFEGKNMNIATNESVTSYGEVHGMAFFGMYHHDRDDKVTTGIYNPKYSAGMAPDNNDRYIFTKGSYVLGLHKLNHNYEKDGFYTNYLEEGEETITVKYIEPTPEDASFYMWVIGEMVREYNVNLTASKYSTLGAVELPLLDFSKPNTSFMVLGFNYQDLDPSVELIPYEEIPRIAESSDQADTVMGLSMKTSNQGWITKGETNYLTNENQSYEGTTTYVGENSNSILSLLFYLYHSKNLGTEGKLGSVSISLLAMTKVDDLTSETERLVINVDLSRALYATNDYEGAITAGKQYSLFTSTVVDITSKSSFSTYFSLYSETDKPLYKTGDHRSLVSTYVFPVGTKITMIDLGSGEKPEYYYHVIDEQDKQAAEAEFATYQEVSYDFKKFTKMGSINSNSYYDDEQKNQVYYNATNKVASEEFIFIIDFKEANITTDQLDKSLLMELRNENNQTIINVLGIEQQSMKYDIYANKDAIIEVEGKIDPNPVYIGKKANLTVTTNFTQNKVGSNTIYDTTYFDEKLGLKITVYDSNGKLVPGTALLGMEFIVDGVKYYPDLNGVTRINIAERVANISEKIVMNLENADIATDDYTLKIESFGSPDGIYFGSISSDSVMVPVRLVNDVYGLKVTTDENSKLIDKTTGNTMNKNNSLVYFIDYSSGLSHPNIRMKLYRRTYDNVYSTQYEEVDFQDYVTNVLTPTTNNLEYMIADPPVEHGTTFLNLKENLKTGTYQVSFRLYDDETMIGEVYQYFIVQ